MNKKDTLALEATYMQVFNEVYITDDDNQDMYILHRGQYDSPPYTKETAIRALKRLQGIDIEVGLIVPGGEERCHVDRDPQGNITIRSSASYKS